MADFDNIPPAASVPPVAPAPYAPAAPSESAIRALVRDEIQRADKRKALEATRLENAELRARLAVLETKPADEDDKKKPGKALPASDANGKTPPPDAAEIGKPPKSRAWL